MATARAFAAPEPPVAAGDGEYLSLRDIVAFWLRTNRLV